MASSDTELLPQLRMQTGYSELVLDSDDWDAIFGIARRHIRVEKGITQEWNEADWYEEQNREEALFWFACLFAKVATGELDSQSVSVGSINQKTLMSKETGSATIWYRNAKKAMGGMAGSSDNPYGTGSRTVVRDNRLYGDDAEEVGTGTDVGEL